MAAKSLTILSLLFLTVPAPGQSGKFTGMKEYESWVMNYYKRPEPARLFDGFDFGVHNRKIAKSGNRTMIIAFYSSCLRSDTLMQLTFYDKIKNTRDTDFIYAYGLTLLQIHTDFSLTLLEKFLEHPYPSKYREEFDSFKAGEYLDIFRDPITHPQHLDMLWSDFFATGNDECIKRIISKLSDLNSTDYFNQATAGSAQWSLASNAVGHDKVLEVCRSEKNAATGRTAEALATIIQVAESRRAAKP